VIHLASGFSSSGTIGWTWTSGSVGFGSVAKSASQGTFVVGGQLRLSGVGAFERTGGSYGVRRRVLEDGASGTYQAGDQFVAGDSFAGTSVSINSGSSLTLGQNLAVDYLSLSGAGSTLQRTGQTLTAPELGVSEGASLDLIAGDVVDAISVGNYSIASGNSTLSLQENLPLTGGNAGLQVSSGGTIAGNGFSVSAPSLYVSQGGSVTLGQGYTFTDGVSVNVNSGQPAATLTLAENLVLTGETARRLSGFTHAGQPCTRPAEDAANRRRVIGKPQLPDPDAMECRKRYACISFGLQPGLFDEPGKRDPRPTAAGRTMMARSVARARKSSWSLNFTTFPGTG
jgi:hypothetical protein